LHCYGDSVEEGTDMSGGPLDRDALSGNLNGDFLLWPGREVTEFALLDLFNDFLKLRSLLHTVDLEGFLDRLLGHRAG